MFELISSKSIIFLITASVASACFCSLLRKIGLKYSIVSRSSYRRDKEAQVPLMGGLGIYLSLVFVNIFLQDLMMWKLFLATLPIVAFGVFDDLKELPARYKFFSQCLAAFLWIGLMTPQEMVYTRLGLPPLLGTIVTTLFLVTLANAYNFLDGIDGQIGLLATVAILGIGISSAKLWPNGLIFASAILGFMVHNYPPARIYLGEVGSSLLGFSAGAFATLLPVTQPGWATFWAINFIFCIAFVDLIRVVYARIKRGQSPWLADKDHFHHRLLAVGLNNHMALFVVGLMAVLGAITAYELQIEIGVQEKSIFTVLSTVSLCIIYFGILYFERQIGRRSSLFGRQLITKYIKFDKLHIKELARHSGLVIDLLPYFSEVQSRGIMAVDAFAFEFGELVASFKNVQSIRLVGSYSVAIIFDEKFISSCPVNGKVQIFDRLQQFFLKHKAVRALLKTPEGISFYESLLDPEISRLLELHDLTLVPTDKLAS